MLERPEATTTLGLEIDGKMLKGALLSSHKGKPRVDKLYEIPLDNVNPLYMNNQGKEFKENLQKALVVSALNTSEVLIRPLEIKLKKDKDIEEVLAFQMEPLLPYSSENAILDSIKIRATDEGSLLTVLAVRKDHLDQHLKRWSELQIEPEMITAVPAALVQFGNILAPSDLPYFIVHLGMDHTSCVLVQEGRLLAAQSISQGIFQLKESLSSEQASNATFGDVDLSQLTAETHPSFYQSWERLRLEIKRLLLSLGKIAKDQSVKEVLITGPGALIPHLASTLAEHLELQIVYPRQELFPQIPLGQVQNFAIPLGAAFSGLPKAKDKLNFRQQESVYPHPWKRLKKPLLIYATLCLALAAAFYFLGEAYLSYRQDKIKQSYIELLSAMDKPYTTFEKSYENKISPSTEDVEVKGVLQLNSTDIQNRVEFLEKELKSMPEYFALLPNVPRVSDVLAWLSQLNILMSKKNPSLNQQPLQVENFNYTLVKRPEQNKKQERYQVKVELEFTSPTPKQAREFHDMLIAPNEFVDPKGEVKWNSSQGRYKTSFYLKDRTVYPSPS